MYDFRKPDTPPILLILDRRNDPVTPLLNQWTYQAMVHELLGIDNGRVDLSHISTIKPENKEIVLSVEHDNFYANNMFLNLGDLGANIKNYVQDYQSKHHSTQNIESIADMKRFVEEYPEFQKLAGNVSKHVTLVGELSSKVEKGSLLEFGELEQTLACVENHDLHSKSVQRVLGDPNVAEDTKVKLVLLYALRYEKTPNNLISTFTNVLKAAGVNERKLNLVSALLQYGGANARLEDIFGNTDLLARTKNALKGLKVIFLIQGVENVYTQHSPRLVNVLNEAIKGKLKDGDYPFYEGSTKDKPQDLIVFMVGGATYGEAREVTLLNASNPGVRILFGGTTVHNSSRFKN